ncbi:MAG: hypothetical protein KBD46_01790 [Candidatus Levybacteria bacterium]|nr:hypothetical protein [Candidatus Levybacteria bacterium]
MAKNKKGMSAGTKMAVGAGMVAAGAAAYAFLGPEGKKNRKKAKVLISKAEKTIKTKALPKIKGAEKTIEKIVKKYTKKV